MSMKKFSVNLCFLYVIILHELMYHVNGVPTRITIFNATKIPNTTPIPKSTGRNARLLGKFSLLAGLGLPDPVGLPIRRDNFLLEQQVPSQYSTNYNFPPTRWGPYVAAVYEPLPILTYLQNQLSYLASALNPLNWFASSSDVSGSGGTSNSIQGSAHTVTPDRNQEDEVVLLVNEPDNEIPDEDLIKDKIKMKIEQENLRTEKLQNVISAMTSKLSTKLMDIETAINEAEKNTDLVAEETTIQLIEEPQLDDRIDNESRQKGRNNTVRQNAKQGTKSNITVTPMTIDNAVNTNTTDNVNTTDVSDSSNTMSTAQNAILTDSTATEMISTTIGNNITTVNANEITSPQSSTAYPNYHNGYYYYGHSQNVSHIAFTTPATAMVNPVPPPVRLQNTNVVNRLGSVNYYDAYDPRAQAALDYYNRFDQIPPEINNHYRNHESYPDDKNFYDVNGFRPSYPYYF